MLQILQVVKLTTCNKRNKSEKSENETFHFSKIVTDEASTRIGNLQ